MSQDWYKDIQDFHKEAGHYASSSPHTPPMKVRTLRHNLIKEEMLETLEAISKRDLEELADGITDSIVVLLGTAISYGIDIRPIWDAVHKSNMLKVGGPKRKDGKSLKPKGWKHPDIQYLLAKQIYREGDEKK